MFTRIYGAAPFFYEKCIGLAVDGVRRGRFCTSTCLVALNRLDMLWSFPGTVVLSPFSCVWRHHCSRLSVNIEWPWQQQQQHRVFAISANDWELLVRLSVRLVRVHTASIIVSLAAIDCAGIARVMGNRCARGGGCLQSIWKCGHFNCAM